MELIIISVTMAVYTYMINSLLFKIRDRINLMFEYQKSLSEQMRLQVELLGILLEVKRDKTEQLDRFLKENECYEDEK